MSEGMDELLSTLNKIRGGGNGLRKYDVVVKAEAVGEDKGVIKVTVYRLEGDKREVVLRTAFLIPVRPGRPLAMFLSRGFKAAVALDINKDVLGKIVALFVRELIKEKLLKGLSLIQKLKQEGVGGSK